MSWHQGTQSPRERGAPPSAPLPTSQAGRTLEHKRSARFPERKGPGPPPAPGRPLRALPDARPVPGGAASKEAAALQPEMLGPGAALPASRELLAAGAGSGSLYWGPAPHARGSGERGAGRCQAEGQARGPMGGWELARGVVQARFRPRLGSSRRHLPAPGSWVLTVLRPRASAHVRPRRREKGRASGEQGRTRLHGVAQGGLSRSPARSAGSRRLPQGVHARRRCAQARRWAGGYQSPRPADRRK